MIIPLEVEFDIETLKTQQNDDDNELIPAPIMTYEPIDHLDNLIIVFDDFVLYPSDIKNYTSKNAGAEVFEITYEPSETTIDYFY